MIAIRLRMALSILALMSDDHERGNPGCAVTLHDLYQDESGFIHYPLQQE